MKTRSNFLVFASLVIGIGVLNGCKKEPDPVPIPTVPAVATEGVSSLGQTTATVLVSVKGNGGAIVTEKGVCWSTAMNPTIADNKVSIDASQDVFLCTLTELRPNTAYYARAYATNSAGTGYGFQIFFQTHGEVPVPAMLEITTIGVTYISPESAYSGIHIISYGDKPIIEMGVCWGTHENPTTNDSKRSTSFVGEYFTIGIDGLKPLTKYYVRSFVINSDETVYGNKLSFTTPAVSPISFNDNLTYGSVSDIDDNIYKTIQIGSQLWMAENLKTTRLNDGTLIPEVTDSYEWGLLTTPGYCWFQNDAPNYKPAYGALYNWYAVSTNKLCPTGWHVPAETEINALTGYLGGDSGNKLVETGNTHWLTYNTEANNESGFTGLPGGTRHLFSTDWDPVASFIPTGYGAQFWTATEDNSEDAMLVAIYWDDFIYVNPYPRNKIDGLSVRCVKD